MKQIARELSVRLRQDPAVLLLGQAYLKLDRGADPFLADVLAKYGPEDAEPRDYNQVLRGTAHQAAEAALSWMQQRSERMSTPKWLEAVASLAWSSVYTSAIDALWYRSFRSQWRELHPIFQTKVNPADPRNRTWLHCTFLFGCINRAEEGERPPLSRREWLSRKQDAIVLARRLPEIITPFGVLVIEGYDPANDWLPIEDLLPILDSLNPGQAHLFSASSEDLAHSDVSDLIEAGKITAHREGLASHLIRAKESGLIQLGLGPEHEVRGRRIQVDENVLQVPSEIWNVVSKSALILDDSITIPPKPVSEERRYLDFRNFLAESGTVPVWSGYARGFAFRRDFEAGLAKEVNQALRARELQQEPIILHGQSGTGKTIALGSMAYETRKKRGCPVLFIERKSQQPFGTDLDVFCKWAEDNGARNTLIIWDGMLEVDQYYDLLQYLVGRGRKVVLVGSSYRFTTEHKRSLGHAFIEAPARFNPSETVAFSEFLSGFHPELASLLSGRESEPDATFLVWLYRLLPPTRSSLRSNLIREVLDTERRINRESVAAAVPATALGHALWEGGLVQPEKLFSDEVRTIGGEDVTEIEKLVGLIMVPGRFGLKVPLEPLLRALGKEWMQNLVSVLSEADIFQWYEDLLGNIAIGPRHPLEAQLIVHSRFGNAVAEVAFAKELILEVRGEEVGEEHEIQFVVDLVRSMGPNGQYPTYFLPCYPEISDAFRELREVRGVQNPRLMLQEANLIREWVVAMSRAGTTPADANDLLDRAETILRQALDFALEHKRSARLRSIIYVELGSVLASKTRQFLDHPSLQSLPIEISREARTCLFRARSLNPEDYHPLDVMAWMTDDLLKAGALDQTSEAEAKADLLYLFSTADPDDFDAIQKGMFHQRRLRIGQSFGRSDIAEEAFEALENQGSKAGYYLRASYLAGEIPYDSELDPTQKQRFRAAVDYLEDNRQKIAGDSRCLYLLLRLWWMLQTGKPILYQERQSVQFTQQDWRYAFDLTTELLAAGDDYPIPLVRYVQALAAFHLGSIGEALSMFRDLEREADYVRGRRRIIRSYLASTEDGRPRVFHGTVAWMDSEGRRGEVYVEELRRKLRFIPTDFPRRQELRRGDPLGKFHIAFNFIGPIADRMEYRRGKPADDS